METVTLPIMRVVMWLIARWCAAGHNGGRALDQLALRWRRWHTDILSPDMRKPAGNHDGHRQA